MSKTLRLVAATFIVSRILVYSLLFFQYTRVNRSTIYWLMFYSLCEDDKNKVQPRDVTGINGCIPKLAKLKRSWWQVPIKSTDNLTRWTYLISGLIFREGSLVEAVRNGWTESTVCTPGNPLTILGVVIRQTLHVATDQEEQQDF